MIQVELEIEVRYDAASKTFVSYCPALDVYSQGVNETEARAAIEGAVALYLAACRDRRSKR